MTLRELLKSSMRAAGIIDPSQTPSAAELFDVLEALNLMLENWFLEEILVYAGVEENFTLTATDNEYTIGSGGDFNTSRPYSIIGAFIREDSKDHPVSIISEREFNELYNKASTGRPFKLNYLPESPLGKIRTYPTPSENFNLHIQCQKPLAEIAATTANLSADVTFDQGYGAAIKWNLALDICPEFDVEPSQIIVARAEESLDRIRTLNAARKATPVKLNLFGEAGYYDHDLDSYVS